MKPFRPIEAIFQQVHAGSVCIPFRPEEEWLLIFAHFANLWFNPHARWSQDWAPLNATSSINNRELAPFRPREAGREAMLRLAGIFQHAGWDTEAGLFLWRLGIRTAEDLHRPIQVPGRPPRWALPWWANQVGRWFKKPGPNRFHKEARWVHRPSLSYCPRERTWALMFFYAYKHEESSWCDGVYQRRREGLEAFGKRVDAFIAERFEPEGLNGPGERPHRERLWHNAHQSIRNVFTWGSHVPPDFDDKLADILCEGPGLFQTTPAMLATLKRWARQSLKAGK